MFKTMYSFWSSSMLKNNLASKLNLWFLGNIRLFLNSSKFGITYLISSLSSLKSNNIKSIRTNSNFISVYSTYLYTLVFIFLVLILVILI